MSVNMPQLHTLLSNALVPQTIDAMLLITVTGAIVISASSFPQAQRQRTSIALAAIATETWTSSKEGVDQGSSEQGQTPGQQSMASSSNEVQGGWATTEHGNVFVYPIVRPSKSHAVNHEDPGVMFLLVANGPEEAGWDLLEERAKLLAEHLAPIFAGYIESNTETPPQASTRLPNPARIRG